MLKNAPLVTVLIAEDISRAKKFYNEKLGLSSPDMPVPEDSAAFECGNGTMLYMYEREGGTKADHTVGTWLVSDIEKTVEDLRAKGVSFEQYDLPNLKTDERGIAVSEEGGARSAWFKDTEGNILSITEIPS